MCDIFYFFQVLFHFQLAPGIESLSSYLFFLGSIHYGVPRCWKSISGSWPSVWQYVCSSCPWSNLKRKAESTGDLYNRPPMDAFLVISQVVLVGIQVPCVEVQTNTCFTL
ncbi:hypothetical protein CK203_014395 [Vitis vinifera]|uniref:Uncharacterized protein n=1 Tax=Vitis vinifera TaxID=29760 RepID=A0A438K4N8_VITVI|nr:hypothetical protein CK203_014395 [Vitis vinifera]